MFGSQEDTERTHPTVAHTLLRRFVRGGEGTQHDEVTASEIFSENLRVKSRQPAIPDEILVSDANQIGASEAERLSEGSPVAEGWEG